MTAHVLLGDPNGPLVRRKIVVFKRLEPGDAPSMGSHPLKESPYLEGRVVEIAIGKEVHDEMVRLEKRRIETLQGSVSLGAKYDVPGMLIAGGGGGLVGAFFDFLPLHVVPYLGGVLALGVVLGFVTRMRKRGGEVAAEERWRALPDQKTYDGLARELTSAWLSFASGVKQDPGYHVELRVAEGSDDPLRIASIDPRGFLAMPPTFDPEDFLPTEGAGVRYEVVHAMGDVVTRLLEGVLDSPLVGAGPVVEKVVVDERASLPVEGEDKAPARELDEEALDGERAVAASEEDPEREALQAAKDGEREAAKAARADEPSA